MHVYRDGKVRRLKDGIRFADYKAKYPDAIQVTVPRIEEIEEWAEDEGCEAIDGCWIEPDGYCEHGFPSWLIALGWI